MGLSLLKGKNKMKIVNVEKILITNNELNKIYDVMGLFDEIWENSNSEDTIKYAQNAVETMQDFIETVDFDIIEE